MLSATPQTTTSAMMMAPPTLIAVDASGLSLGSSEPINESAVSPALTGSEFADMTEVFGDEEAGTAEVEILEKIEREIGHLLEATAASGSGDQAQIFVSDGEGEDGDE